MPTEKRAHIGADWIFCHPLLWPGYIKSKHFQLISLFWSFISLLSSLSLISFLPPPSLSLVSLHLFSFHHSSCLTSLDTGVSSYYVPHCRVHIQHTLTIYVQHVDNFLEILHFMQINCVRWQFLLVTFSLFLVQLQVKSHIHFSNEFYHEIRKGINRKTLVKENNREVLFFFVCVGPEQIIIGVLFVLHTTEIRQGLYSSNIYIVCEINFRICREVLWKWCGRGRISESFEEFIHWPILPNLSFSFSQCTLLANKWIVWNFSNLRSWKSISHNRFCVSSTLENNLNLPKSIVWPETDRISVVDKFCRTIKAMA